MSYTLPTIELTVNNKLIPRYTIGEAPEGDEIIGTTYLGTPVYSNLQFLADPDTTFNETIALDTILMTVAQTRNIVKTAVQGRNGTVKEYISDGDYSIDIRGAIVSEFPLVYPTEIISNLVELFRLGKQLGIASKFLGLFGIDAIVIESYNVAEKLGSRNEVIIEINAISDTPLDVIQDDQQYLKP